MAQAPTRAIEASETQPAATSLGVAAGLSLDADVAFAIDVAHALIVDASPAARDGLGLGRGARLPVAIDSAMPALHRLRVLAEHANPIGMIEALDFWSRDGRLLSGLWHVTTRTPSSPTPIVIVRKTMRFNEAEATGVPSAPEFDSIGDLSSDSDRPPPRDDSDTLKEIARQIREGQLAARAADERAQQARAASSATFEDEAEALAPVIAAPAAELAPDDLARLAHELKTPLTAIAAAAEIMRDERLGEMGNARYLDYARDVHESATHALAVIQRLLAHGGDHEQRDRIELIDLNDLVERTVATLQPLSAERRITLAVDVDEGCPSVLASSTALRQILINLVANALKFTPARGDVRVITGYLDTGRVFLAVRDTGDGIDAATVAKAKSLTQPPIEERAGGGYGIGLPLTCRLVADIGAEIDFESQRGRGSVVLISF